MRFFVAIILLTQSSWAKDPWDLHRAIFASQPDRYGPAAASTSGSRTTTPPVTTETATSTASTSTTADPDPGPRDEIVVTTTAADPNLERDARELDGEPMATGGCLECVPDVLGERLQSLIADVERIVNDDVLRSVDAPQAVVNQALAKSKELVCAEMEMFIRAHKLSAEINCLRVPQIIPPIHMQVIKFPGLAEKRRALEEEIAGYQARLRNNARDFTADSLLRRKTKDLECLVDPDPTKYVCMEFLELNFTTKAVVQVELQDKSGQWYEFKQMPVDYFSGLPGPKTKQGDYQVPEARYKMTNVNPGSRYFTAVHVDYENWSQRSSLLGDLNVPVGNKGGDIKIHGNGGSVGCLDMGNRGAPWMAAIVDLSLKRGRVPEIDIYPTDMDRGVDEVATWERYQRYDRFWDELKKRYWNGHSVKVRRDLERVDQMLARQN